MATTIHVPLKTRKPIPGLFASMKAIWKKYPAESLKNALGRFPEDHLRRLVLYAVVSEDIDKPYLQALLFSILTHLQQSGRTNLDGTATPQQQRPVVTHASVQQPQNPVPQQHPFGTHPSAQQYHPGIPNPAVQQQSQHQSGQYAVSLSQSTPSFLSNNSVQQQQQYATNPTYMSGIQQSTQHHHQRTLPRPNIPAVVPDASAQPRDKAPSPTAEQVENKRKFEEHMAARLTRWREVKKEEDAKQALQDQQTESGLRSDTPDTFRQAPPFPNPITPQVALPVPVPETSQPSRPASLTRGFAPAAINEPVKARTRPTSWPVPVSLMSSTADWNNKYSDDDSKEDVKPPISPPLSPLPAQNSGKTKRKLSVVDLTGDNPVSRLKRARKVKSKDIGVVCGCKPDVRMKIARLL
jgi:hypothetical protein